MSFTFDPLVSLSFVLFQIGSRYLKINLTKAQEKILSKPITQGILYASIIFYSTRNLFHTLFIVILSYVFLFVLFNENHKHNILSPKWLYDEKLIDTMISYKENYKKNFEKYHL